MNKVAVIVAEGFEKGETLTIIDIISRAGIVCDSFGLEKEVIGSHQITLQCDEVLNERVLDYDMIVLPGGLPGATNLRDCDELIQYLKEMNNQNKYVCAMCAAPIALDKAGLLSDKNYTAYVGYDQKIKSGHYLEDSVVQDGNIITSRGPATVYDFAYYLVDVLGGDSLAIKHRMLYFNAFKKEEA